MTMDNVWGISGTGSDIYHSCFAPTLIAPWTPRLAALGDLRPATRVLDVACGTGALTRYAARAVGKTGRVVGLDISPDMLTVARRETSLNGTGATIEWQEGSADALPYADGEFDVVFCQLGLMFFPDRLAALRDMRRVLAPGGRVAVMTWGPLERTPGHAAMAQVWASFFGSEQAAKFQPMHSLNDPAEARRLLEAAGFAGIDVQVQTQAVRFASPQALACSFGALVRLGTDAATRDAVCAEMARLLRDYCRDGALVYPTEAVLARADRPNG